MRSFETITELMSHQKEAVNKLLPSVLNAVLMEQGTGKSRTVIEMAKIRHHKIDKVVWFCPVSLKVTVQGEILKHTNCTRSDICVFDDNITEQTIPDAMWYVIGIESMSQSARVILTAHKLITERTWVILDESIYCKNHRAQRTARITAFSKVARYRAILTGIPITQGIVDLYAQFYFLSSKILGYSSFYSFAANHLEYSEKYPGMIVQAHNTEYLAAKIKPYTYQVLKSECMDLPKKQYDTAYFSMTNEQIYAYDEAKMEFFELIDRDEFNSVAIFRLFTTLQQIVSGFVKVDRKIIELENDRLKTLLDAINRIDDNEKVIIWAKFHYDIERISAALIKTYGESSVAVIYGKVRGKKRDQAVEKFRGSAKFLVVTQSTGGHGFTFVEARYAFFYNNGFKFSERKQAEDREHRIGQEREPVYIDIHCSGTIDDRIWQSITNKGSVLTSFRDEVNKVKKERMKELVKAL